MRSTGASASKGSQAAPVLAMAIWAISSSVPRAHPQADDVAGPDALRRKAAGDGASARASTSR